MASKYSTRDFPGPSGAFFVWTVSTLHCAAFVSRAVPFSCSSFDGLHIRFTKVLNRM